MLTLFLSRCRSGGGHVSQILPVPSPVIPPCYCLGTGCQEVAALGALRAGFRVFFSSKGCIKPMQVRRIQCNFITLSDYSSFFLYLSFSFFPLFPSLPSFHLSPSPIRFLSFPVCLPPPFSFLKLQPKVMVLVPCAARALCLPKPTF